MPKNLLVSFNFDASNVSAMDEKKKLKFNLIFFFISVAFDNLLQNKSLDDDSSDSDSDVNDK